MVGNDLPHHGPRARQRLVESLAVLALRAATGTRNPVLGLDVVAFRAQAVVVIHVSVVDQLRMSLGMSHEQESEA